jgi:hypothetical protein
MVFVKAGLGSMYFSSSVLPDGLLSNQNSQCGQILERLAIEDVSIVHGHLVYFTAIEYILLYFAIWYIFPRFGMFNQEKSGKPAHASLSCRKIVNFSSRVTRLDFFTSWVKIVQVAQISGLLFPGYVCTNYGKRDGICTFGLFFTNSSGRPAFQL